MKLFYATLLGLCISFTSFSQESEAKDPKKEIIKTECLDKGIEKGTPEFKKCKKKALKKIKNGATSSESGNKKKKGKGKNPELKKMKKQASKVCTDKGLEKGSEEFKKCKKEEFKKLKKAGASN